MQDLELSSLDVDLHEVGLAALPDGVKGWVATTVRWPAAASGSRVRRLSPEMTADRWRNRCSARERSAVSCTVMLSARLRTTFARAAHGTGFGLEREDVAVRPDELGEQQR